MKKKLVDFQNKTNKGGSEPAKNKDSQVVPTEQQNGNVSERITELEAAVLKQVDLLFKINYLIQRKRFCVILTLFFSILTKIFSKKKICKAEVKNFFILVNL